MQHSCFCYLFWCCLPKDLANCTDCSGCSSELLHCHGETHGLGLPTRSHISTIFASTSKGLKIHLWYQSEAFIRRAPFGSRVSSDSKKLRLLPLKKYLQIICQKSLVSSQTHVFAPELSNSSAQPTPRNCVRSLSAKAACSGAFHRSCSFGRGQSI